MDWNHLTDFALQKAIEALGAILAMLVPALIAYWQPKLKAKYEAGVSLQNRQLIEMITRTGVTMAEQLWARPEIQALYRSKKQLAESYIYERLSEHGLEGSAAEVNAMIESWVAQLFPGGSGASIPAPLPEPEAPQSAAVPPAGVILTEAQAADVLSAVQSLSDILKAASAPALPLPAALAGPGTVSSNGV